MPTRVTPQPLGSTRRKIDGGAAYRPPRREAACAPDPSRRRPPAAGNTVARASVRGCPRTASLTHAIARHTPMTSEATTTASTAATATTMPSRLSTPPASLTALYPPNPPCRSPSLHRQHESTVLRKFYVDVDFASVPAIVFRRSELSVVISRLIIPLR